MATRRYDPAVSNRQRIGVFTLAIGAVAAIAGLILGLVPTQQARVTCGSPFAPVGVPGFSLSADYVGELCRQALVPLTATAWSLLIAGVLVFFVGLAYALLRPAQTA